MENRGKGKAFSKISPFDFNGKKIDFSIPRVMGILNITPDSFYSAARHIDRNIHTTSTRESQKEDRALPVWMKKAGQMASEGAYFIDIGAVSTRPGAPEVGVEEEKDRLLPVLKALRKELPDMVLSVDTYRAEVARMAVSEGADMINDISAGTFDPGMMPFIAQSGVPYILMHIQGTPASMQKDPKYKDVVREVHEFLEGQCKKLLEAGNHRLIIDPGFGFGKTMEHNYELLAGLDRFLDIGFPVLAGLSRKSMINRVLKITPENALNGTTVLNTVALLKGAGILRVHDVKEAMEAVKLTLTLSPPSPHPPACPPPFSLP